MWERNLWLFISKTKLLEFFCNKFQVKWWYKYPFIGYLSEEFLELNATISQT